MTSARMAGLALLLCCSLVAAQDQQPKTGRLPRNAHVFLSDRLPGNVNMVVLGKDENGRYIICGDMGPFPCDGRAYLDWLGLRPAGNSLQEDAAQRLGKAVDSYNAEGGHRVSTLDPNSDLSMVITPAGMDGACFTIRSIVVARDRKDSDATHFVRTTTCQPSSRYRLRTAEQTDSSGH